MFGDKLKKLRTDNNMTQEELAAKLFVARTAVSKWELNKGYPNIDCLKQISQLFNTSIDELISEDDMKNSDSLKDIKNRQLFLCSMICLAVAVISILVFRFSGISIMLLISVISTAAYVVFALLYLHQKRRSRKKTYVISRIIIIIIFAVVVIPMLLSFAG